MCVFLFLLNYHSALGCTCCTLISKSGCAVQGVQRGMFESHSLIMKDQNKKTPNLYREHDQDVSNDSDQTQRSSNEHDERHLHSRVRASREKAGFATDVDVTGVGWIENLHAVWYPSRGCFKLRWHVCKTYKLQQLLTKVFKATFRRRIQHLGVHRCKIMQYLQHVNKSQVLERFRGNSLPLVKEWAGVQTGPATAVFTNTQQVSHTRVRNNTVNQVWG